MAVVNEEGPERHRSPENRRRDGEDLSGKLKWLLFGRMVIVLFCTAVLLIYGIGVGYFWAAYRLLFSVFLLNLFYILIFAKIRRYDRFAFLQILMDGLWVTLLIYFTGGVQNIFTFLYLLIILAATLLISGRFGIYFASGAAILTSLVSLSYYFAGNYSWKLPLVPADLVALVRMKWNYVVANLVAQGVAYHVVALLATLLARELRKVRVYYQEILEQMGDGLLAVDRSGQILFINDKIRELLSYKKQDMLVGRDIRYIFRRKEDNQILEVLLRPLEQTFEMEVEMRVGKKSIEVKTTVLRDKQGRVYGVIGIFSDLTLKKRLEEAERRALRLEGIEEVAMGIAHEIRNPLASIRGGVQEIAKIGLPDEDSLRLSEIIVKESDRLDGIINEFLQFARMKPALLQKVDVEKVLDEVSILLRSRSGTEEVRVNTDLIEGFFCSGDPELLKQLFLNLGINAIEAMKDGGELTISMHSHSKAERFSEEDRGHREFLSVRNGVEVEFRDTGRGIPTEDRIKIFTPFYTTKEGGTGLGLSVASKIVRTHRGMIEVESEPSVGSSFRVWLPKAEGGLDS
jgi:two-component system sensor histidine kinase PilS (NtrC family)